MEYLKLYTAILLLSAYSTTCNASANDALAPTSKLDDALTQALHTVTISTQSLEQTLLFYRDGMGLTVSGPLPLDKQSIALQRKLWNIPHSIGWQMYLMRREEVAGAVQIRLLVIDKATASIHKSWSALELGPFSIGFPNMDQDSLDKKIRRLGFGALNEIEKYRVPRPDKSLYRIDETIFNGPDFVHGVGIHRGANMPQLGPIDTATGLGGPAYSAQVVEDSDSMLSFFTHVLGMELRSDRLWKSAGSKGALNVPDGTVFRFSIVYAKGATSGHLLFVDYQNTAPIDPGVAPRLPHLGIGMWSFPVTDLDRVLDNAQRAGVRIVQTPITYKSPALGKVRVATLLAPNGFPIELFEEK